MISAELTHFFKSPLVPPFAKGGKSKSSPFCKGEIRGILGLPEIVIVIS